MRCEHDSNFLHAVFGIEAGAVGARETEATLVPTALCGERKMWSALDSWWLALTSGV